MGNTKPNDIKEIKNEDDEVMELLKNEMGYFNGRAISTLLKIFILFFIGTIILNYLPDLAVYSPFNSQTWGTVSDWVMIIVTAITAYFLWSTLDSQRKMQVLQTAQTAIIIEDYAHKTMPKMEFYAEIIDNNKTLYNNELVDCVNIRCTIKWTGLMPKLVNLEFQTNRFINLEVQNLPMKNWTVFKFIYIPNVTPPIINGELIALIFTNSLGMEIGNLCHMTYEADEPNYLPKKVTFSPYGNPYILKKPQELDFKFK